jgi:hypothetical protein
LEEESLRSLRKIFKSNIRENRWADFFCNFCVREGKTYFYITEILANRKVELETSWERDNLFFISRILNFPSLSSFCYVRKGLLRLV